MFHVWNVCCVKNMINIIRISLRRQQWLVISKQDMHKDIVTQPEQVKPSK